MSNIDVPRCVVELVHHGAAASSQPKTLSWASDYSLIYSSHGTVNIAQDAAAKLWKSQKKVDTSSPSPPPLMNISQTLRTTVKESVPTIPSTSKEESTEMGVTNDSRPVITALCEIVPLFPQEIPLTTFTSTLSNGSIHIWIKSQVDSSIWREFICTLPVSTNTSPINCIHGQYMTRLHKSDDHDIHPDRLTILFFLCTANSESVDFVLCPITIHPIEIMSSMNPSPISIPSFSIRLGSYMAASVRTHALIDQHHQDSTTTPTATTTTATTTTTAASTSLWNPQLLLVSGTASPKGNRIHIHSIPLSHSWIQCLLDDSSTLDVNVVNNHIQQSFQQQMIHHGYLLGHLDWISCLSFESIQSGNSLVPLDYLLASGSHDTRIRLWKLHGPTLNTKIDIDEEESSHRNLKDEDDSYEPEDDTSPLEDLDEGEARMYIHLTPSQNNPQVAQQHLQMHVSLEALLIGHEGRVTSVSWRPRIHKDSPPCLLSSSMDRSILLWMEERRGATSEVVSSQEGTGIWVPMSRVGSAGGILGGAIGSSLLGYVDATFSPCSQIICGHAYGGSLHFWVSSERFGQDSSQHQSTDVLERWFAAPSITGHFRQVSDISWEAKQGSYLLSVSSDQTCRLWSTIWNTESLELWREVARPQVHGYDLNAVACIGDAMSEPMHRFVSGADEKEIRVFDAPLASIRVLTAVQENDCFMKDDTFDERVERAFVPALGLSNRYNIEDAMIENDGSGQGVDSTTWTPSVGIPEDEIDSEMTRLNRIISVLPFERDLGVISVWPEFRKLFGHQSEVVCLAVGRCSSSVLASTSKARDVENASIRLWDVQRGSCTNILKGHKSTVVTLSFSSDGLYLASAGKDRRICLWKMSKDDSYLASSVDIAHKRIIWSVHFCPAEPKILASGSRDGTVKLWYVSESSKLIEKSKFEPASRVGKKSEPVTAVAFAPRAVDHGENGRDFLLAIGLESGFIEIWSLRIDQQLNDSVQPFSISLVQSLPVNLCHFDAVKRLQWRPCHETEENKSETGYKYTLASCSSDHGVRIFNLYVS